MVEKQWSQWVLWSTLITYEVDTHCNQEINWEAVLWFALEIVDAGALPEDVSGKRFYSCITCFLHLLERGTISFWFVWVIYLKYWKRSKPPVYPEKHLNDLVSVLSVYENLILLYHWRVMKHSQKSLFASQIISSFSYIQRNILKKSDPTVKLVPTFNHSSEGLLRWFGFQELNFGKTDWYPIIQLPFVPSDSFHHFIAMNSKCFLIAEHFLIQMIGSKGQSSKMPSAQRVNIWTNY